MPSSYTTNNGIELIATGEQSGTWGDTTNTNLSLIDTSLDGQVTVTLPSAGTSGSPNDVDIVDGTTSNGRNRLIIFNDGGDLGATAYVRLTPSDAEKIVYIRNSLSGSRSILAFQGTYNASNDYEIPSGTTAVIYFDGAGSGAVAANVFNNAYFDSLRLGSVSVTAVLDEDNMASDSATALATQQSIKAYTDNYMNGTTTVSGIDINSGTIDGTTIGGSTAAAGTFTTLASDSLTVDTNTLVVDATNNRVGIGEASPAVLLDLVDTSPIIRITDSDTGADTDISGANSSGSLFLQIDKNNTAASSTFQIAIDGSEVMRVTDAGNVGINTTSPGCKLDVSNSAAAAANNEIARLRYSTSTTAGHSGDLNFASTAGTILSRISSQIVDGSNVSLSFSTFESGTLSENFLMQNDGDFHADGDVIAYSTTISDERLKDDIKVVESALDKVKQLRGVTFKYKTDGKVSAGVIAQEVEKVLPEAVSDKELPLKADDGEKYKVVQYDALHALMIEAIKELSDEVARLKGE